VVPVPVGKVFSFPYTVASLPYFSDPEGRKLQYKYKLLSGEGIPDWFRITLSNETITGFPKNMSNFVVEVIAIDPTENFNS